MTTDPFVDYYESQSAAPQTIEHFLRLRDLLLSVLGQPGMGSGAKVADIGCGAGTFSRLWAEAGCRVMGLDVNPALVDIARKRAGSDGIAIDFRVGSADALPWPDSTFDIVVMPELLEHVPKWRACLAEASRVLRTGGVLYVSTTNRLCPVQQEFDLPAYSWYPAWLKRRCLELAMTTHREWVNHAKYPAVNWFDPYLLATEFRALGLEPMDRFEVFAGFGNSSAKQALGRVAAKIPPLRFAGHVFSSGTTLIGRKR